MTRSPVRLFTVLAGLAVAAALLCPAPPASAGQGPRTILVDLPVATQGPLWPPSDLTNANGDFLVVGFSLATLGGVPGIPLFDQAVLVSKDSVPPLDENGDKINNNWFLASYDVIRPLNLSPGSPDLDMVLYALSIGPPEDGTTIPRVPAVGDSAYNLYTDQLPCQEVFPSSSQLPVYGRQRYALHEVPIWGFQGDGFALDVHTGDPYVPNNHNGPGCGSGCPGEEVLDYRPQREPITLGDWLAARGTVRISLTDFDRVQGGYTAADFNFKFRNLVPSSVYTVLTIRPRRIPGSDFFPQADPLGLPNILISDRAGNAEATLHEIHPFPDPANDPLGHRVIGVIVAYHPDYKNWGACGGLFATGVDIHTHFNSLIKGNLDFTPFVTVPPQD
jgi:hypothetical protein